MRAETKPKKIRLDRNEVVGFRRICVCLVLEVVRCDIAWCIAIYRDIISHTMRHHKIRYIEISYPYPECLGRISRYRIPSKYFLIPNTIFCPVQSKKRLFGGSTSEAVIFTGKNMCTPTWGYAVGRLGCCASIEQHSPLREMATNNSDIISQLSDCSSSDE